MLHSSELTSDSLCSPQRINLARRLQPSPTPTSRTLGSQAWATTTNEGKTEGSPQEAEAGGCLWVLDHPGLHSEFQVFQGFLERPCLKKHISPSENEGWRDESVGESACCRSAKISNLKHTHKEVGLVTCAYNPPWL